MFKVAYGFGLRRRELARLELADFHSNPQGGGVRPVRCVQRSLGQGRSRRAPAPPVGVGGDAVDVGGARGVPGGSAGVRGSGRDVVVADRAGRRREHGLCQPPVRGVSRRAGAAERAASALLASLLCDASARGWLRPVLRAAAGGPSLGRLDGAVLGSSLCLWGRLHAASPFWSSRLSRACW